MATNFTQILHNLISFYNFRDKTVAHVGIGGGALINYANLPKKIFAIDNNKEGLLHLKEQLSNNAYKDKFVCICKNFCDVQIECNIVLFEFCLHEMENPLAALSYAKKLAPEVLIIDHLPKSPWSWYTLETEKLTNSWNAVRQQGVKEEALFEEDQYFTDYNNLQEKLKILGSDCTKRIEGFKSGNDIKISMPYSIVLL